MKNIKDMKCIFPVWHSNYTELIPKLNKEYNVMGYARTSIGTPDQSSGKNKVDAIPYTLQLNIFQIAQHYKQPHQNTDRKPTTMKILSGNQKNISD